MDRRPDERSRAIAAASLSRSEATAEQWVAAMPRVDLNLVHHALRVLATHPMTTGDDLMQIELLAEALWTESRNRSEGQ
jgi:hypothetical protein